MGWPRLVGPLKLQVSFATEPYNRDYILQERTIILNSLPIVATSYPKRDIDTALISLRVRRRHRMHIKYMYSELGRDTDVRINIHEYSWMFK